MNGKLANARAIAKQLLCDNFRPEVASDVVSGVDEEQFGMNVHVKFVDFRSNRSRDIRLPHFVTNDAGVRRSSHKGKTPPSDVLPKNVDPARFIAFLYGKLKAVLPPKVAGEWQVFTPATFLYGTYLLCVTVLPSPPPKEGSNSFTTPILM